MATDKEIVLKALQRERDELHERIMQVDRIIKKLKSVETLDGEITPMVQIVPIVSDKPKPVSPVKSNNIKILVLNVFDVVGRAARLKDLQIEYERISGNKYNIRETIRGLHRANRLKMIKDNVVNRATFWAKSEWIEHGKILDQHKPEGFDLLYKDDEFTIS